MMKIATTLLKTLFYLVLIDLLALALILQTVDLEPFRYVGF